MATIRVVTAPTQTSRAPTSPVRSAPARVVVLGDLGSAILTIRHVLDSRANGHVKLVDAPIVEGAVVAAVTASAGCTLDDVVHAAEEARDAHKL